jgi:hypothetical protein
MALSYETPPSPRPALTVVTLKVVPNGGVIVIDGGRPFGESIQILGAFANMPAALGWLNEQPWKGAP